MAATESPLAKRPTPPTIGTHDGTFHCDEALAVFLLRQLPAYAGAAVVRTRDAAKLAACDVVVDVGGVYDPATLRYDHHQRSFTETMASLTAGAKPWTTRLSSAGLVFHHYGHAVIAHVCKTDAAATATLFDKMYEGFIEEVDAVDNGIDQYAVSAGAVARYRVTSTLSHRVKRLAPDWNEPSTPADQDACFAKAVELAGGEFLDVLRNLHTAWMPARSIVADALAARFEADASGEIVLLPQFCPWGAHLSELEPQYVTGTQPSIKYVLFGDSAGKWRIQAVAAAEGSFELRLALPEPWRGIRDQALSDLTGVPGCIFVHANGFIGGAETKEAVLALAKLALAAGKK